MFNYIGTWIDVFSRVICVYIYDMEFNKCNKMLETKEIRLGKMYLPQRGTRNDNIETIF